MKDELRRKSDLVRELAELRAEVARLREADIGRAWAEEASKFSEQRYRQIFDSAPVSIWEEDYSQLKSLIDQLRAEGVTDFGRYLEDNPDFVHKAAKLIKVTDVNQETLRMFGASSKDELMGSPARVLPAGSVDAFRAELIAIAEGKSLFETEGVTHVRDGAKRNVLVRIAIPPDPEHCGYMLLSLMDITEFKESEEALRISEARFRAIFEAASDCIYIKGRDLRFTHANPAMQNMFRPTVTEIVGCTAEDLYGAEAGRHIEEVDARVLAGDAVEEEHTRPANGVQRTFHDIRVPLRNSEGEIIALCGISRDITERMTARRPRQILEPEYRSQAMQAALAKARYGAATDSVILLLGESGCGKDHMAGYIHEHSSRNKGPFFSINCAALSHDIAESELFGHEQGAFTGARTRKRGLLELAEGGTLLLNEIGELSLGLQSKLLTFLDTKSFTRVGGEKTITVNARLIAATHRDLKSDVEAARFLPALIYRLDVFPIHLPPLRERIEDLPILVEEIISRLVAEKPFPHSRRPAPEMMRALANYSWPGNIRELRNVLERSLILPDGDHFEFPVPREQTVQGNWLCNLQLPPETSLSEIRHHITRSLCIEALGRTNGNKKEAAKLLGISRYSFYRYIKGRGSECEKVT